MLGSLLRSIVMSAFNRRTEPPSLGAPAYGGKPPNMGPTLPFDYPYRPRMRDLPRSAPAILRRIESGAERYAVTLESLSKFAPHFERIALTADQAGSCEPRWHNGWFPALDAISLYGLVATINPRSYVEIGSGNSTLFVRRAIRDHGLRTIIRSIDPAPRAEVDAVCDEVIRQPCEDLPLGFFDSLSSEDLLFVDNSHRSFPNSDVTVFFVEILPKIPCGMIYGIHDIFLPWDYPEQWSDRFYNEQYLLAAYLLGGAGGDEIVLPNAFLSRQPAALALLNPIWNNPRLAGIQKSGGAFWLRRGAM